MIAYLSGRFTVTLLPQLSLAWLFLLLLPISFSYRGRWVIMCLLAGVLVASLYGFWQLQCRLPLALKNMHVIIANRRKDALHKFSRQLVAGAGEICVGNVKSNAYNPN